MRTVLGPLLGTAVVRALAGARRCLARPECARIFSDFDDGRGRPLQDVLDSRGLSGPEFLDTVRACLDLDITPKSPEWKPITRLTLWKHGKKELESR